MTEQQLLAELETMGITVETHKLTGTLRGYYNHRERLIVIRQGLSYPQRRTALAHELVHARRGDDGHQGPQVERRVNQATARLLISPIEYALAERIHGPNVAAIARELDVTQALVQAYVSLLQIVQC